MTEESRYLRSRGRYRAAIKEIVEMPDAKIDRVIRSVQSNRGDLSGVLRRELPIFEDSALWAAVVEAVHLSFEVGPKSDAAERYEATRKPVP